MPCKLGLVTDHPGSQAVAHDRDSFLYYLIADWAVFFCTDAGNYDPNFENTFLSGCNPIREYLDMEKWRTLAGVLAVAPFETRLLTAARYRPSRASAGCTVVAGDTQFTNPRRAIFHLVS